MELLPLELKKLISEFLEQKSKFNMRVASTEWLKILQIRDYKLYNISKKEWKEVVENLEKKADHIRSLTLLKTPVHSAADILPLLTNLTQLTSFNIPKQVGHTQWMPLTILTTLKSFNLTSTYLELALRFPNLEEISLYEPPRPDQLEKIKSATNVQRLSFFFLEQWPLLPFDIIQPKFAHLTSIQVNNHKYNGKDFFGGCRSIFPQLKTLQWHTRASEEEQLPVSLHEFSAVEDFYWSGLPFTGLNSKHLTKLASDHFSWNEISQNGNTSLVNLKTLDLDLSGFNEVYSFKFLTALTALEDLSIDAHATTANFLLNLANSKKLSKLVCHIRHKTPFFSFLTRLTSLTSLDTWVDTEGELNQIGAATQLVEASIFVKEGNPSPSVNLSRLLNLEKLHLKMFSNPKLIRNFSLPSSLKDFVLDFDFALDHTVDLGLLPNLEKLEIIYGRDDQYVGIEKLTKLVHLKVRRTTGTHDYSQTAVNQAYLTNFTNLETFYWSLEQPVLPYLVNAATRLRSLTVFYLSEEFENLSPFRNLTFLQVSVLPFSEMDVSNSCLTRLTKLQVLKIAAKNTSAIPLEEYLPYLYESKIGK